MEGHPVKGIYGESTSFRRTHAAPHAWSRHAYNHAHHAAPTCRKQKRPLRCSKIRAACYTVRKHASSDVDGRERACRPRMMAHSLKTTAQFLLASRQRGKFMILGKRRSWLERGNIDGCHRKHHKHSRLRKPDSVLKAVSFYLQSC